MKRIKTWSIRLGLGLLGICSLSFVLMGLGAVPEDETIAPEAYGAGASSVSPSYTGLERAFPSLNGDSTPESAELGQLLFFDPVLSAQNDLSCATCYRPDYGFADGLPLGIGAGGQGFGPDRTGGTELKRNTMALWNVGYNNLLLWEGQDIFLETQAKIPLEHSDEMAIEDRDALVSELTAIPEYVDMFAAAYGDEAISFDLIRDALAAFQRTLISDDSRFDHFAAGNREALTPSQRRGLTLFRSAALL